jgi:hypothetical protein
VNVYLKFYFVLTELIVISDFSRPSEVAIILTFPLLVVDFTTSNANPLKAER